ncbi:SUMO-specific isopeptidase USPL1 isoform X1 [Varanus komodoensis]|uniref:SUMO-specific isopeptidase USPL1 isoform X1 n=1 Tax=Varanus komodoensis TaxID=61221 RepID=UPI001CF79BDB|nr:SUMO-specific isopeptidase USPL1 isoform X1 [Varanus komodoensis]XP_044298012.1 SUMO-specific isopeptidase USPL1 isoform X1 [Varanus komodoensis]XP_044298013.1 SUMO-specific isopeptidase USPL1 isoform X1 [Varanus komodoensis]XP_044298015.1 SUMO-specific isopeptidase USPL1 isoform X1 [Varanus komodoensis]XP_044298016.1 SUMO-specific isopeptidase USPL1 isoform X1 [Varanus komodoensis]XP_044298017.1 SUMO-specific isopeptidase USPL1 isoform X1 [Varanus komodoensis]
MMDYQKIGNGLQVTGIGASALHMVGYMGKDSNAAEVTPSDCCPACKKKNLIKALRTYRINFEESIFLCENPQCIYPLGFESLSNIVIPNDPKGYPAQATFKKRKFFDTSLVTSPVEPCIKLTKTDNLMDTKQTLEPDHGPECNENDLFRSQSGQPDFSQVKRPNLYNATEPVEQQMSLEMAAQESLPETSSMHVQLLSNSEIGSSVPQILHQDRPFLSEPLCLHWRNSHALCWLDCILSVLVHLATLKTIQTSPDSGNTSIIKRLFAKYGQATALVNTYGREVPLDVLTRAETYLNEIRNQIFEKLQPNLKCKLGEEESPVFAFPLLLREDPGIEKLFLHTFLWKLQCLQCGHQVSERCQKTMTTFTNIIPEWHPLNAVHIAPCNNCNHTSQRRQMILENRAPPILMMHFVEGLPHNDLMAYSFNFQEDHYKITTVIQYQKDAKHFITWILNSDDMWLECDDLKGCYSRRHENFGVPPAEIHIMIWERKPLQETSQLDVHLQNGEAVNFALLKAQAEFPVKCLNDVTIGSKPLICYSESMLNEHTNETQNLASNNKSSLLWGLENMAPDDTITLNLVSVPLDSKDNSLKDCCTVENNLIANMGISQLQAPGQVDVLPVTSEGNTDRNEYKLLKKTSSPLHQGQPDNASNRLIMPDVPLNSCGISPETFMLQGAEHEVNPVLPTDSRLALVNNQPKTGRTNSGNGVLETPKFIENIMDNSQVSFPSIPTNSSQAFCKNGIKPSGASWLKGLLGKYPSFMPKSISTYKKAESSEKPIQKESRSNSLVKHASHFRGFQSKYSKKSIKKTEGMDSSHKSLPLVPSTTALFGTFPVKMQTTNGSEGTINRKADSLIKRIQPQQGHNEKNSTSVENGETATADKTHQLRLKLLQQLKAKKEKLASLDKLAEAQVKTRCSFKKTKKDQSQLGSQKENESLQSLLNALQHQIDVEERKSLNSPSTNTSQCSSSSYDDILSELLSPATTIGSLDMPQEEECRYLEMGAGSPKSPESNEKPDDAQDTKYDHHYYSPVRENGLEGHTDLLTVKSPLKKLNFGSPATQDILEDLFSSSVMDSIMADTDDLHHFDETLLSW